MFPHLSQRCSGSAWDAEGFYTRMMKNKERELGSLPSGFSRLSSIHLPGRPQQQLPSFTSFCWRESKARCKGTHRAEKQQEKLADNQREGSEVPSSFPGLDSEGVVNREEGLLSSLHIIYTSGPQTLGWEIEPVRGSFDPRPHRK